MPRKNLPPPKRTIEEVKEAARQRRAVLVDLRKSGLTYQAIADATGICKTRARVLVRRGT